MQGVIRCSSAATHRGSTRRAGCSSRRRFRDELAEGLVITKGQERCLYVLHQAAEFAEQSAAWPRWRPVTEQGRARDYLRVLRSHASSDETPDKQGRITIPASLREYAGLDRDVRRHRRRHPLRDLGRRDLGRPTWREPGGRVRRAWRGGAARADLTSDARSPPARGSRAALHEPPSPRLDRRAQAASQRSATWSTARGPQPQAAAPRPSGARPDTCPDARRTPRPRTSARVAPGARLDGPLDPRGTAFAAALAAAGHDAPCSRRWRPPGPDRGRATDVEPRDASQPAVHVPVLLDRVRRAARPGPDATAAPSLVDATLGLGGHSEALLGASPSCAWSGWTATREALRRGRRSGWRRSRRPRDARARRLRRAARRCCAGLGLAEVQGVLFDLGVSSPAARRRPTAASPTPRTRRWTCGWTRVGRAAPPPTSSTPTPAGELARILRVYGEERFARTDRRRHRARARARAVHHAAARLAELVRDVDPGRHPAHRRPPGQADLPGPAHRGQRRARRRCERALPAAVDALAVGGRIVVHVLPLPRGPDRQAGPGRRRLDRAPPDLPVVPESQQPRLRLLTRGGGGRRPTPRSPPTRGRPPRGCAPPSASGRPHERDGSRGPGPAGRGSPDGARARGRPLPRPVARLPSATFALFVGAVLTFGLLGLLALNTLLAQGAFATGDLARSRPCSTTGRRRCSRRSPCSRRRPSSPRPRRRSAWSAPRTRSSSTPSPAGSSASPSPVPTRLPRPPRWQARRPR